MRPIRKTIPVEEALRLADEAARPLDRTERVELDAGVGRVLAAPVAAGQDVPPFDRAAMDGYAVVAQSTFGASRTDPRRLDCVETVHTGDVPTRTLEPGQCTQIATGAPMPDGADAVVMVEETDRRGPRDVAVFMPVYPRQHVGRRGADITRGTALLQPGDVLTPSRLGSIAALGIAAVEVYARPRVALLSTGGEIAPPGRPLGPGQIYDINRFTLGALIREHGGLPTPLPTAPDNLDELGRTVDGCLDHDILVFSGGSSVGERDLTLDVIRQKGELLFHGIAVKPGKPTACGVIGETLVLGMPGYPPPRACRTATCCSCRSCARWPACPPTGSAPPRCPPRSASSRPAAGTSSTPSASSTGGPCPPSRHPATSRACRRPTATSRSPPAPTSSRKARRSR